MTEVLQPALPWDILREIAVNCPPKTCATLICTCTFFSHEAAASMLRNYVISLYDEFSTAGFVKFLRPGKRKKPRYPFVRHLALRYNPHFPVHAPLSPDTAKELADAFALMTGLVAVRIREYTMVNWPVIGDAISSLPSLRRIDMYEAGPRSCQSFLSLQSANLRSIQLNISDLESERAPWVSSHPVQLFGRWTSTLTELQYHSPFVPEVQYTPSCYPEVYPMMRTLSICHRGRVDLIPYIRAFPNLAHLTVEILSRLDDEHEYRTSNLRSQREVQHLGPASKHPSWQELVQCNGFLVDLYALALSCRISHIRLDNYIEDDRHLPLLLAVLADARPIHLNIFGFSGILCHPTDSLSSVLRTQGAPRLESLVVTCLIRECHQDHVASALVGTVQVVLGQATLVYLS
ncbi:hypothetical protein C8Q74DRAFT_1374428 [Fomes fomentarius]|nr:hypothetical protein C8Q74DRAFT_1374428 [Fomes fomentarius]